MGGANGYSEIFPTVLDVDPLDFPLNSRQVWSHLFPAPETIFLVLFDCGRLTSSFYLVKRYQSLYTNFG
ncbi:hypothetical protein [Reichenbachiella sp. MSK19-1]|uniref:hypothetical protein n=1 Tax=Reichenbachiella sp. MSK19-1 TaxID=1897631 RepID=UPI0011C3A55B|nr:hypothetical protein [Reichenbachiella sp. MSK19-1]